MMDYLYLFSHAFFFLQIVFDVLLLFSLFVFGYDILLKGAWKLFLIDKFKIMPIHVTLTVFLAIYSAHSGLGAAVKTGVNILISFVLKENLHAFFMQSVILLWFVGAVCSIGIYLIKYYRLTSRINRTSQYPEFYSLVKAKKMTKVYHVKCIESYSSPIGALGTIRPVIVLPKGFTSHYSEQEQLLILTHELYHIKHHDVAFYLVMQVLYRLFYLHKPIKRQLRLLMQHRELRCDQRVIAAYPSPAQYADLLLRELSEKNLYTSFASDGYDAIHMRICSLFSHTRISYMRITAFGLITLFIVSMVSVPLMPFLAPDAPYALVIYQDDHSHDVLWLDTAAEADKKILEQDRFLSAKLYENHSWFGILASYAWGDTIKEYS